MILKVKPKSSSDFEYLTGNPLSVMDFSNSKIHWKSRKASKTSLNLHKKKGKQKSISRDFLSFHTFSQFLPGGVGSPNFAKFVQAEVITSLKATSVLFNFSSPLPNTGSNK